LFPAEDFRKVLQTVMRRDGIAALGYGERNGYAPLRESITHILASQGLQTRPENILITSGSQQALSLVSQLLLKPGTSFWWKVQHTQAPWICSAHLASR